MSLFDHVTILWDFNVTQRDFAHRYEYQCLGLGQLLQLLAVSSESTALILFIFLDCLCCMFQFHNPPKKVQEGGQLHTWILILLLCLLNMDHSAVLFKGDGVPVMAKIIKIIQIFEQKSLILKQLNGANMLASKYFQDAGLVKDILPRNISGLVLLCLVT